MSEVTITLNEEDLQFIQMEIQSGRYITPSEAIAEALAEFRSRREEEDGHFEQFRAKIEIGLDQLNRGEGIKWDPNFIKSEGRRLKQRGTGPNSSSNE